VAAAAAAAHRRLHHRCLRRARRHHPRRTDLHGRQSVLRRTQQTSGESTMPFFPSLSDSLTRR